MAILSGSYMLDILDTYAEEDNLKHEYERKVEQIRQRRRLLFYQAALESLLRFGSDDVDVDDDNAEMKNFMSEAMNLAGGGAKKQGVDKKVLDSMERRSASAKDLGEACAICQDKYKETDVLMVLPCGHAFHDCSAIKDVEAKDKKDKNEVFGCIRPWLKEQDSCPMCRKRVVLRAISSPLVLPGTSSSMSTSASSSMSTSAISSISTSASSSMSTEAKDKSSSASTSASALISTESKGANSILVESKSEASSLTVASLISPPSSTSTALTSDSGSLLQSSQLAGYFQRTPRRTSTNLGKSQLAGFFQRK